MAVWRVALSRFLEQEARHLRCVRLGGYLRPYRDHHSLHAGRLGAVRWRFPGDAGNIPYERRGTAGRLGLPAERGRYALTTGKGF